MAGVVIPDPRGGHVWIYGVDSAGNPVKILVDTDGHLQVDTLSSALPTGAATSAKQDDILTELQEKLETADLNLDADKDVQVDVKTMPTVTVIPGSGEKLFGFSGIVSEEKSNTNLSAGNNALYGSSVPAGEVWVIKQVTLRYVGTSPTRIYAHLSVGGVAVELLDVESPVSGARNPAAVDVLLEEGDKVIARVEGATAGDDFYLRYCGYKLAAP